MARRFAEISEEEIKTAFFYPSDLVNTKTTIPLGSVKSGGMVSIDKTIDTFISRLLVPRVRQWWESNVI